jgi:7-cyano-7-deazaguanine synthase
LEGLGRRLDPSGLFDQKTKFHELPPYTGCTLHVDQIGTHEWEAQNKILSSLPNIKKSRKRALVICSGGVDSSTSAAIARKLEGNEVTLLHMNYNQRAYEREKEAVQAVAKALDCDHLEVDVSSVGKWDTNSPLVEGGDPIPEGMRSQESTLCWTACRNMLFLTVAATYAESKGYSLIYSGFSLEEAGSYPDNTKSCFDAFDKLCEYGTLTRVKCRLAIARLMKAQTYRLAYHLGVPMESTWSCDSGGVRNSDNPLNEVNQVFGNKSDSRRFLPCGTCGCCWGRRVVHKKIGIEDMQGYAADLVGPVPEWYSSNVFRLDVEPIETIISEVMKRN